MEWLMGKARGVSRGIMGGSSPASPAETPVLGDAPPAYARPAYACQQLCTAFPDLVEPFPPQVLMNEWLASHTIALFDNISTLYDAIYELCICSVMSGPGTLTYVATDDRGKKLKCTARQYMDSVLAQSQELIKSTKLFPTRQGDVFASDFRTHVTAILRNLFRVLVHLYASHFDQFAQLDLVAHLNTVARHFFALALRFGLVDEKEMEVLGDLQTALAETPVPAVCNHPSASSDSLNSHSGVTGESVLKTSETKD